MEKLAYYLLQPLRPENWTIQGAPYLVLRKNEGLNTEKLTNYHLRHPGMRSKSTVPKFRNGDAIFSFGDAKIFKTSVLNFRTLLTPQ